MAKSFIIVIHYRGLLGSNGYYIVGRVARNGAAVVRSYVCLDDVVWC